MPEPLRVVDIILEKKIGHSLSTEEIEFMVQGYTHDQIPDYQVAAWLMAVCWQGMDERETTDLTLAMAHSGDTLDLHDIAPVTVDKHSTGGVGDKTSLVLTPLLASCGLVVAKMSGRGLGFSGGTIDKLESIPGFHAEFSLQEFRESARRVGLVISAQSLELAPADKKLYALRDVTGTVDSLPLIASSIMSKKLAAGSDCIVLDVKVGRGAFMPSLEAARTLGSLMVRIGQRAGRKVRAVLSDMDQPLGRAVGNAIELREAIDTLHGQGPADLIEVCLQLGGLMLQMAGQAEALDQARAILQQKLASGAAWEKFKAFVVNQGGSSEVLDHPELLPRARYIEPLRSPQAGYVSDLDARQIAQATIVLGAGRTTKNAPIDHAVGVILDAKVGEHVDKGQPLLMVHANDLDRLETARGILEQSYRLNPEPVPPRPLILEVI
jgi:pyrimidine-nucleoside phosphorylase